MSTEITRNQLIEKVKALVEDKRSSTVYARTDDNRSIIIGIDAGEIVSLVCGPKRGEQAIPVIRDMVKGTYQLQDKVMSFEHLGARPTSNDSLLSLLSLSSDDDSGADHDQETCDWVRDVFCKALAAYMGPIAPLVCTQTISAVGGVDSPDKVRRVVDALAAELDDAREAERFKAKVHEELGRRVA